MKSVLISGAGIAGLALAHLLRERGFAPTVVERAPEIRPGGQAIDVRGVALDVLDRMGLLDRARKARTRMRGMTMLDRDGAEKWRSEEMTLSGGRFDSDDIELLRDDLTDLLYGLTRDRVEHVFGDALATLDQEADGVRVTFESGRPARTFDLVVGADGLRSRTRRLAFGPEDRYLHHLGPYVAVFSTGNFLGLDNWQIWLEDEGVSYCLYPVRDNTELRATMGFLSEPLEYDHRDTAAHRELLAAHLGHLGWETPRLLAAMRQAPDLYFDAMAQIRMDAFHEGRVVLVGDAAHCPSPLSGQGTSLALTGAYVLADELAAAAGDHTTALPRYTARLHPFALRNQALAHPEAKEDLAEAKHAFTL